MDKLTHMKSRLSELQHREEEAYQQVKRSVKMVEQAQLRANTGKYILHKQLIKRKS